ncbi:hypothetical protein F1C58_15855 [Glaciihabitans sp. INWT7]|uniref:hypothetical protein n=1 Tax=Glaciihabitans sp. INWT7 TaxID=2596912 RepID=UPI00162A4150|nr:hypothetical protein [Glaciihabitans sp. INWT7]QNE48227.1 hypothetical protein F1C58_15855 [Glaciihabitans sp. INWT7]
MPPRILARWLMLAGVLLLAFFGTVTTLNLTLYSASGFVSSYLSAVARHDVDGARRMPGVTVSPTGTDELLAPAALSSLTDIRLVKDTDDGGGRHTVLYGYTIGGAEGTSSFVVEHSGGRLGVFSAWRFVQSPQSLLSVTVKHGSGVLANGVALPPVAADVAHAYRVLTPSRVVLTHTSTYLGSVRVSPLVDQPASVTDASVDIQANTVFVREVQKQLDKFLAACTTQKVLLPTGCPMGTQITDRLQDAPTWSIVSYPIVTIVPGASPGSWQIPETGGLAHLRVKVRSIFDGSLSTFDDDVPFTVRYVITFAGDGSPVITAQY